MKVDGNMGTGDGIVGRKICMWFNRVNQDRVCTKAAYIVCVGYNDVIKSGRVGDRGIGLWNRSCNE